MKIANQNHSQANNNSTKIFHAFIAETNGTKKNTNTSIQQIKYSPHLSFKCQMEGKKKELSIS